MHQTIMQTSCEHRCDRDRVSRFPFVVDEVKMEEGERRMRKKAQGDPYYPPRLERGSRSLSGVTTK